MCARPFWPAAAILVMGALACSTRVPIETGALYSVDDEEGGYRIAKVLLVEDKATHIRLYKNRFKERPAAIDPATLTLGTIDDVDGFGIGHLPLHPDAFLAWHPVLIQRGTVQPDELEGYEIWKEAGDGPLGGR